MELLDIVASAPFWIAVLRVATPLVFGTLGVLLCERAGVLNLGIEGIMVAGAFCGWLAVYHGAPLWGGVAVAASVGLAFGLLHGWLTVSLALSQHVAGLGVTMLATSLSYYAYRLGFASVSTPPTITPFAPMHWIGGIPLIGGMLNPVFGEETALTLLALVLVPVVAWLLYGTPLGLAVRMVGENPAAAQGQGIRVGAMRIGAIMAGSALMAVGRRVPHAIRVQCILL